MNKLASVMSEAMKQFEEAMKDVTPEKREMMEKIMKGRMSGMGGSERVEPVLKKVGMFTGGKQRSVSTVLLPGIV